MLSARQWGSWVSERDPYPPSCRTWSPLTCPARPYSRDLPNNFKSLRTSFSALGSRLFSVWNVLFWFWVKPQEKGFYFWNAHFQLYIPLDGIRFSGIGVCANGILSHVSSLAVETCCLTWEREVVWLVSTISCPSYAGHMGRKESASEDIRDWCPGAWTYWFVSQGRNQKLITSTYLVPGTVQKTLLVWSRLMLTVALLGVGTIILIFRWGNWGL